jgi:hypothetical protein
MARTKWNTAGAVAHVRPKAQRAVNRALLVGEGVAKANTPVLTGTARRSVHIEEGPDHPTRVSGQLGSDVAYFKWIEIGSRGRRGKYMLAQGLQAAAASLQGELKAID